MTVGWRIALTLSLAAGLAVPQDKQPEKSEPLKDKDKEDILFIEKARVEQDGRVTVVYQVGHDVGKNIAPLIQKFLAPQTGWYYENEPLHLLVVSDTKQNIEIIDRLLKAALTPPPQCVIEAKVIELRWTKDLEVGFAGDAAGGSAIWVKNVPTEQFLNEVRMNFSPTSALLPTPFIGSTFRFRSFSEHRGTIGGVLQMFVERGRAEILSNPRLMVESGKEAVIDSGESVPYPETTIHPGGVTTAVRYKDTGVRLMVRPHIVSREFVALEIHPSVSAVLGTVEIASSIFAPSFTTRSLTTHIIVRNNEEVAIGGLIRKETTAFRRGIPLLSEIPLLGYLFGRTEEEEVSSEIIFLIKPRVIASAREIPHGIFDPSKNK